MNEQESSRALAYVAEAEQAAATVAGVSATTPLRLVAKVGVIGAGTMGIGIAMSFLSAGLPVNLVDQSREALDAGVARMRRYYDSSASKGRITPEQVAEAVALLSATVEFEALRDCDLIIEAVYENLDLKLEIFARLDALAKAGAILASNTSFLDVNRMAQATARPGDVLGMHFFSPANIMRLVEVIRGDATTPDVLATVMALARRIGKVPVISRVCSGFIGNRMLMPRQQQATALLMDGASPEQIDAVHVAFGMPMGPFQMADLAGLDIGWHRDPQRVTTILEALCAAGRWGQKTGAGFYDYDDRRRPTPSSITADILARFRASTGHRARVVSEDEIIARTFYPIVNEGARVLEEGISERASDVDLVWIYGFGWPAIKGGPMYWAETLGTRHVLAGLEMYRDQLGGQFELASRFREEAQVAV